MIIFRLSPNQIHEESKFKKYFFSTIKDVNFTRAKQAFFTIPIMIEAKKRQKLVKAK